MNLLHIIIIIEERDLYCDAPAKLMLPILEQYFLGTHRFFVDSMTLCLQFQEIDFLVLHNSLGSTLDRTSALRIALSLNMFILFTRCHTSTKIFL